MTESRDDGRTTDNPEKPKGASRRRRAARALAIIVVLLTGSVGGAWMWIESDAGQERIRRWVVDRARSALQRDVRIGSLELDLVPFETTFGDVVIAGPPGADRPLLRTDTITIRISPWALLSRRVWIRSLQLVRPDVHWDVPAPSTEPVDPLPATTTRLTVSIDRIRVTEGSVEIDHRRWNVDTELDGVGLEVQPEADGAAEGRRHTGVLRIGTGSLDVGSFAAGGDEPLPRAGGIESLSAEARFTYANDQLLLDGSRLVVGRSELEATGVVEEWRRGRLEISGRLAVVDVAGLMGADYEGTDDVADLDGVLTLAPGALDFTGELRAASLDVVGLRISSMRATIAAGGGGLVIDDIGADFYGGTLAARLSLERGAAGSSWSLAYEGNGVDLSALTTSDALPGFRFVGTGHARGSAAWRAPWRDTISGSGELDLELPPDALTGGDEEIRSQEATRLTEPFALINRGAETPGGSSQVVPTPSLPLPLEAHAEYELLNGDLRVRNATASLPRTVASLDGDVGRDGALRAAISLQTDDLRMLDRFFTQVRRFRGERPVPRPLGISGTGRAAATIGGTTEQPTVDGVLAIGALQVAGNPVGDIDGALRLSGSSLQLTDLRVRREGGQAVGEGTMRIGQRGGAGPDYNIALRLDGYPMEVTLPRLGVPLSAAGEASGELSLTGAYGSPPSGFAEIRGNGVRLNEVGDLSADIRVRLDADRWVAERFDLTGPRLRLVASGAWQRADDVVEAQLDGLGVDATIIGDLLGTDLPVAGTFDMQARLTGSFAAPDAAATMTWTDAEAYGVSMGSVASSAEIRAGALALSALGRPDPSAEAVPPPTPRAEGGDRPIDLPAVPPAGWAVTLSVNLREPRTASVRAAGESNLVLAAIAAQGYDPGVNLDVEGRLEAEGTGRLGDWRSWTGTASLADFTLARDGLQFSVPDPASMRLEGETLYVELPRLLTEAGELEARATIDLAERRWLDAQASGSVALDFLDIFTDELELRGRVDVEMAATGDLLDGEIEGLFSLRDVSLASSRWPWGAQAVNGAIRLSERRLRLVDVEGTVEGRPFRASGKLAIGALVGADRVADRDGAAGALEIAIDDLPLAPLWARTGPLQEVLSGGATSLTLSVRGDGPDWRGYAGHLDVRAVEFRVADLQLRMDAPARLAIADGRLDFDEPLIVTGPGTSLQIGGGFLLDPFRFETTLQGFANLDPFNAITGDWGIAGRAQIDVRLTGEPSNLDYAGAVAISSGLINPPILRPIDAITATLTLENRRLRIEDFAGTLGRARRDRSNVTGTGEIQLVDGAPQRFVLNASVDEATFSLGSGIRLTASADLVHEGTIDRSLFSGSVLVSEANYTRQWESEAELLSFRDAPSVDSELARSVNLDLEVRAPSDVRLVNNMADVELGGDLQIRGTLAEPVILGSATVLDGEMTFRDHRYQILRGSIEFQNPLRTEPNIDFLAETSIRQYLVTVGLSGSPDRGDLQASFSSSPPLSDLQLIQLLTIGDAPDERGGDITLGAVGAQATSFLTRQYLGQVERGAQRVFGIDRFRVEPTIFGGTGDPGARVTVGKQVTPDLWISWTSVLGTTEEQLVSLEYQLTRGIRVTATREEDGSLALDFRFDHRFR